MPVMSQLTKNAITRLSELGPAKPLDLFAAEEIKKLRKEKKALKPKGKSLPLNISGSYKELFTPNQLVRMLNNPEYATEILETNLNREPSAQEIKALQKRIIETYPTIADYDYSSENARSPLNLQQVAQRFATELKDFNPNTPEPLLNLTSKFPSLFPTPVNNANLSQAVATLKAKPNIQGIIDAEAFADLKPSAFFSSQQRKALRQALTERQAGSLQKAKGRVEKGSALHRLQTNSGGIAPLGELHSQASDIIKKSYNPESFKLREKEIQKAEDKDIPGVVDRYLAKNELTPGQFVDKYGTDYDKVIKRYKSKMRDDLLERDIPGINNYYTSKGAFYSGARKSAIAKKELEMKKMVSDKIAELEASRQENAMRNYHEHRKGTQATAEIKGNAVKAQQDAAFRGTGARGANELSRQATALNQAAVLENLRETQQKQKQSELDYSRKIHDQEARAAREHEVTIASMGKEGQQYPNIVQESAPIPVPPSALNTAAATLATVAGMGMMNPLGGVLHKARGGSVRSRHAGGDTVGRNIAKSAAELAEMQRYAIPSNEAEIRQEADAFKNHSANPTGDFLFNLGTHMFANPKGSPMQNFGEGSQKGMQAFKAAQQENLKARKERINILKGMDESRALTQQILSRHHFGSLQHEETQRQHNAQNSETRRAHDMMFARQQENGRDGSPLSFPSKEAEKIFYKREGKAEEEHEKRAEDLASEKTKLNNVSKYVKEGIGPTGPYVGMLPDVMATLFSGKETLANRRLFEKEINREVIELTKELKGTPSDARMAYLKRTIPTKLDDERTIEKYMSKWGAGVKRAEEGIKFIDERVAQGMPRQEAKKQWTRYELENPLDIENEDFGREQSANNQATQTNQTDWYSDLGGIPG